jgi:hypothetical protein
MEKMNWQQFTSRILAIHRNWMSLLAIAFHGFAVFRAEPSNRHLI